MPTPRHKLDLLLRDELLALADGRGVIVGDRRERAQSADQLEAKGPALPELLAGFGRDRLEEPCCALGFDEDSA